MNISGKKLFLIGFIIILLIGIPFTIYFLQKQQETRSRAQKSTILNFNPTSSQQAPIQKKVGDTIPLDVMVDPGTNLVSFVKLQIQYDTDKLATASSNAFTPNTVVFPTVLEGPIYSPGKIEITLSVGPDPTKAIQAISKAGTINFTALANTPDGQPTLVTYGATTQVLSIGSSDQASENVLSSTNPATIQIGGASPSTTLEPIPTGSPTPTLEVSASPVPTTPTADTPTPTTPQGSIPTPTFTPTPTGTGSASTNQAPVCNSLQVDRATTGAAPLAITFTANGSDADGTISKANFNFGDGATSGDITTAGGIGTNAVNVQITHEFQNPGQYTATALLTDNSGAVSATDSCQQTIIVQGQQATATPLPPGAATPTHTPTPTMAPTGMFDTAIGIGAVTLFLIIGGGLLFLVL